jgi:RNA polymerase sigma factor (TIGR02999 family)
MPPGAHGDAPPQVEEVTRLMEAATRGAAEASEALNTQLYEQLRAIARRQIARERRDHTLRATDLVHEAYLRLFGASKVDWAGHTQFFFAAAQAMRRILIEHARKRGRVKRGGPAAKRVPLSILDLAAENDPDEVLALDEAMGKLAQEDERAARVVWLRFYAGLSVEEAAKALGLSPRTVKREWEFARAWLFSALESSQ